MKKVTAITLVFVTLFAIACPAMAAEPRYVNTNIAEVTLVIDGNGLAQVSAVVSCKLSVQKIRSLLYIERKIGNSWVRVELGTTNNVWDYTTTKTVLNLSYSKQLPANGEYRVSGVFTITGSSVETVTDSAVAKY
jgi:hypothetical protein